MSVEPIAPILTLGELSALLKLSKRQIFDFRRSHAHPGIQQLPGPGQPRFSGQAVSDWLSGGPRVVRRQPGTSLLSRRRVG